MWRGEEAKRAPLGDFPPPWASAWGDDVYGLWADLTVNGVTQRMRWIEPSGPEGFQMGSPKQERDAIKDKDIREWANQAEHEPKRVVVEHGFWLADTPCTQAFWEAVAGKNPSAFKLGAEASGRPVENVDWKDVMTDFIDRFAHTLEWGTEDRVCLPTEVQWEYAARAGCCTAYWWGDIWEDKRANAGRCIGSTTPVKRFAPNRWGLFDVHGNVWEWCHDPWLSRLMEPQALPDENFRVVRGGSWFYHSAGARAAFRNRRPHGYALRDRGFRFALRSPAGPEAR